MSCSYCYNDGHNRRTCTQLTQRLEESAAAGSGYAQSMLANRGKGTGHSKKYRKCSFCGTRGHDRRTCLVFKEFSSTMAHNIYEIRQDIFSKLSKQKISPGALVEFPIREWEVNNYVNKKYIGLVTNIRWDHIDQHTYNNRSCLLQVSYRDSSGISRSRYIQPPLEVLLKLKDSNGEALPSMGERTKNACSTVISPTEPPEYSPELRYRACMIHAKEEIKEGGYRAHTTRVINDIGQERFEKLRELQEKQDKAE